MSNTTLWQSLPLLYRYCPQHGSVFNYYKFPSRLIIHVLGNYFARLASSGRVERTAAPPCKMIIPMPSPLTRLPSSIPVAIGPRFLSALPWTQRAISSSSVYRSVSTDRHGVLLPFVIYAALSSGPRQRSYGPDRLNPSVAYISVLFACRGHLLHLAVGIDIATRGVLELPRAGSARVTGRFFLFVPRVSLRSIAAPPTRCDRRGRSLISRLMSFLIALLLPVALFLSADPRSPAQ